MHKVMHLQFAFSPLHLRYKFRFFLMQNLLTLVFSVLFIPLQAVLAEGHVWATDFGLTGFVTGCKNERFSPLLYLISLYRKHVCAPQAFFSSPAKPMWIRS
jgi:hypothetical protein